MIGGERKSDEIMREIMEIVRARKEDSTETKDGLVRVILDAKMVVT